MELRAVRAGDVVAIQTRSSCLCLRSSSSTEVWEAYTHSLAGWLPSVREHDSRLMRIEEEEESKERRRRARRWASAPSLSTCWTRRRLPF